jgi:hypothetical protein
MMSEPTPRASEHAGTFGLSFAPQAAKQFTKAPGQVAPAPCIVREVFDYGAKLQVDLCWISPPAFWLRLNGGICLQHCLFLWRAGEFVGVNFSLQR